MSKNITEIDYESSKNLQDTTTIGQHSSDMDVTMTEYKMTAKSFVDTDSASGFAKMLEMFTDEEKRAMTIVADGVKLTGVFIAQSFHPVFSQNGELVCDWVFEGAGGVKPLEEIA